MKVTFLLPSLKSSGGVHASFVFAHQLSQRGHHVTIAVESKVWTRYVHNLFNRHVLLPRDSRVRIIRVKNFFDLPDSEIFVADSWQVAQKLHAMDTQGKKFHYVQHDERMYHGEPGRVDAVYRYPLTHIPNASWLKRMFKEEFNEETTLLLNAVDCEQFNPSKRTRKPEDEVIKILLLHHDYAWKGTKEGVEVVNALQKKYPQIKLVLFGTRSEQVTYLHDEYHYMLHGDDLARLFANSDIFLGSSWDEGLNFPPRWAMASGVAVLTYKNGSSDDYAFDGETALVAERKNTEELSLKLESLIVDALLRKSIAEKGMLYVRQMPTWNELTDILEGILNKKTNES